jgi:hypothetical protein
MASFVQTAASALASLTHPSPLPSQQRSPTHAHAPTLKSPTSRPSVPIAVSTPAPPNTASSSAISTNISKTSLSSSPTSPDVASQRLNYAQQPHPPQQANNFTNNPGSSQPRTYTNSHDTTRGPGLAPPTSTSTAIANTSSGATVKTLQSLSKLPRRPVKNSPSSEEDEDDAAYEAECLAKAALQKELKAQQQVAKRKAAKLAAAGKPRVSNAVNAGGKSEAKNASTSSRDTFMIQPPEKKHKMEGEEVNLKVQ